MDNTSLVTLLKFKRWIDAETLKVLKASVNLPMQKSVI